MSEAQLCGAAQAKPEARPHSCRDSPAANTQWGPFRPAPGRPAAVAAAACSRDGGAMAACSRRHRGRRLAHASHSGHVKLTSVGGRRPIVGCVESRPTSAESRRVEFATKDRVAGRRRRGHNGDISANDWPPRSLRLPLNHHPGPAQPSPARPPSLIRQRSRRPHASRPLRRAGVRSVQLDGGCGEPPGPRRTKAVPVSAGGD